MFAASPQCRRRPRAGRPCRSSSRCPRTNRVLAPGDHPPRRVVARAEVRTRQLRFGHGGRLRAGTSAASKWMIDRSPERCPPERGSADRPGSTGPGPGAGSPRMKPVRPRIATPSRGGNGAPRDRRNTIRLMLWASGWQLATSEDENQDSIHLVRLGLRADRACRCVAGNLARAPGVTDEQGTSKRCRIRGPRPEASGSNDGRPVATHTRCRPEVG